MSGVFSWLPFPLFFKTEFLWTHSSSVQFRLNELQARITGMQSVPRVLRILKIWIQLVMLVWQALCWLSLLPKPSGTSWTKAHWKLETAVGSVNYNKACHINLKTRCLICNTHIGWPDMAVLVCAPRRQRQVDLWGSLSELRWLAKFKNSGRPCLKRMKKQKKNTEKSTVFMAQHQNLPSGLHMCVCILTHTWPYTTESVTIIAV